MKKLLAVAAFLLLCGGCKPTLVVQLKPNIKLQRLGIYIKRGEHAFEPVAYQLERTLDDFILRYNASSKRKFELFKSTSPRDSSTLTVELTATRLVTPKQQTAGVVISAIGLAMPILMLSAGAEFVIVFWYFPDVRSMTYFSLSRDISHPGMGARPYLLQSNGFLTSPEKQVIGQGPSFSRALTRVIGQLEQQLAASRK